MRDSAGRGGCLDPVVLLEALQPLPEPHAPAEQNRDHHGVHVVDEPGGKEVADHGGASADAYVLAVCGLAGRLERLGGRRVEEVEHRAASISIDGRGWWVRTKTGVWNGGLGPTRLSSVGPRAIRDGRISLHL